jgi:hypothetical protein
MDIKKILFLMIFLCSSLYGEEQPLSVVARFIGGAFHKEDISAEHGIKWYVKNKKSLMELHAQVLGNPKIRRIEPGTSPELVLRLKMAKPEVMNTYARLADICATLEIKHVAVFRDAVTGDLLTVRYTLVSGGLSISGGQFLALEFIPSKGTLSKLYERPEYEITPLDERGWYLIRKGDLSP